LLFSYESRFIIKNAFLNARQVNQFPNIREGLCVASGFLSVNGQWSTVNGHRSMEIWVIFFPVIFYPDDLLFRVNIATLRGS
jgi:hypothetical protein